MDLSVIVPACGTQRYIAACLRSITRCPRDGIDMECIVVVSTGTGETAAVTNRYMERDNRIRLVTAETGELSDARNTGIEKSSGKYILFVDAADRLCEDAWEQIEAAVDEEYADFVAFSWITSRENGKLRARMLPISDVISTDAGEARRLMYADCVLNTCGGKLFKNRIIRDNNIFFTSDIPANTDFSGFRDLYFVAEYFEHCESYLMTKAMILYRLPGGGNVMKDCGMEEGLELLRGVYGFQAEAVRRYHDAGLMRCMQVYYLGMLTDLFCRSAPEADYAKALGNIFLRKLLDDVDEHWIRSRIKRYEYRLLKKGDAAKTRRYFSLKAKLGKGAL